MNNNTFKLMEKGFWAVIILFIIRCLITKPASAYDCFSFAGEAIGIASILMGLYERLFWRYNPFEKTPKIQGSYSGNIEYIYNGNTGMKDATIMISQSLLSTNVKIKTDEIDSNTIASNIVYENGSYILYYTYITNPKSKYSQANPIQFGTCRIIIENRANFHGIYWTTRSTRGDIYLKHVN